MSCAMFPAANVCVSRDVALEAREDDEELSLALEGLDPASILGSVGAASSGRGYFLGRPRPRFGGSDGGAGDG